LQLLKLCVWLQWSIIRYELFTSFSAVQIYDLSYYSFADWQTAWLKDWLINWLIEWVIDCMEIYWFRSLTILLLSSSDSHNKHFGQTFSNTYFELDMYM